MTNGENEQATEVNSDGKTPQSSMAITMVRNFLQAIENRDLEQAQDYLAPDFLMIFPGGEQFNRLEELVAWGRNRYASISKNFEGFDETSQKDATVVYCRGTLSGELPDGSSFTNIRFIDRFEIRDSKLHDQQVWNDMAAVLKGKLSAAN